MKAHIVGGGFGGLAAAALLIRNAERIPGPTSRFMRRMRELGGGFFLDGDAEHGYNLPGSIFDKEFRCALGLLAKDPHLEPTRTSPSQTNSSLSITSTRSSTRCTSSTVTSAPCMGRDTGSVLADGLALAKLSFTPEASLDGQLIKNFFSQQFFETEFWLLWSTLMGSLPQHSIIEFRRYLNRFVYLFPDLSTMAHVFRSQFNQHEAFIKPLVAWLENAA